MATEMRFPASPRDIPHEAPLTEMAAALAEHAYTLVDHRYGLSAPLTDGQLAAHLLAVLAYQAALVERSGIGRWVYAAEAMTAAPAGRVATAMGLSEDDLRAGLIQWADGQLRHGFITRTRHAEILDLAAW